MYMYFICTCIKCILYIHVLHVEVRGVSVAYVWKLFSLSQLAVTGDSEYFVSGCGFNF